MPPTPPEDRDWIEVDDSGPLAVWCDFPGPGVSGLRGRALRAGNIVIPHASGTYPVNPVVDELKVQLLGCLYGIFDLEGDPVAGVDAVNTQLDENRDWLVAEVFDPPGGDGTRTLTLHRVGGNVYSGRVTLTGELGIVGDTPVSQNFTLTVVLVDGGLTLEGS